VRLALTQIRVQKLKSFFTLLGVMIGVDRCSIVMLMPSTIAEQ